MIQPTVGRIVWFWPNGPVPDTQPTAAVITFVHHAHLVDLYVLPGRGQLAVPHEFIFLAHTDGERAEGQQFCEWMPYQKGQAAKEENELETMRQSIGELTSFLRGYTAGIESRFVALEQRMKDPR